MPSATAPPSTNRPPATSTIRPFAYQRALLDEIAAERELRGNYRNLVVAATGTGKTVLSAFDYLRFRQSASGQPCRLLFVAHRGEILAQSLACFRGILRDQNFGTLFVGSHQPTAADDLGHLFLSIQTFHAQKWWEQTTPDAYDYIVVDEVHHAAAATYQKLFSYYQPNILLGGRYAGAHGRTRHPPLLRRPSHS